MVLGTYLISISVPLINPIPACITGTGIVGMSYGFGEVFLDDHWQVIDDFVTEYSLGLYFSRKFSARVSYSKTKLEQLTAGTGKDISYENYSLDGQYYFNSQGDLRPYITTGFGEMMWEKNYDLKTFQVNLGTGFHYKITNNLAVQLDWRHYYSSNTKTSENTKYTRSELREMLRKGNTDINTQGINDNNWVFSSAPQNEQDAAGGVDGTLNAKLMVDHVTITGDDNQVGRVIIGQIHANDDEPIRLYYRKLPNNTHGSIYAAHEILDGDDIYYELIGTRSQSASNPEDGIQLGEIFDYQINVEGNQLTVTVTKENQTPIIQIIDMTDSGYDQGGQYMYFKAGVYNQNNTGDDFDYVQATFFIIENSHQ